ncbi:MAG: FUSC family protein [Burkholderiales bacterium]
MLRDTFSDLWKFSAVPPPWHHAVRALVSIAGPAVVGLVAGEPLFGVIAAVTALNTYIDDLGGSLRHRAFTMSATVFCVIAGGVAGAVIPEGHWLPVVAIFLAGLVAGFVHGSATALENVVRFGAITLVVATTLQLEDPRLILVALAGGAYAICVMLADYAIRRANPPSTGGSWREGWARLRARQTVGWRFAFIYAAVGAVGLLLAEAVGAHRAGWVTLTTLLVMRPDGAESLRFAVQRLVGTLAGVIAAVALAATTQTPAFLMAYAAACAFLFPPAMAKHRWLGVAVVTLMIMLLLDIALQGQGDPRDLILARFYDTVFGCVLGVLGTLVAFPEIWRRPRLE